MIKNEAVTSYRVAVLVKKKIIDLIVSKHVNKVLNLQFEAGFLAILKRRLFSSSVLF